MEIIRVYQYTDQVPLGWTHSKATKLFSKEGAIIDGMKFGIIHIDPPIRQLMAMPLISWAATDPTKLRESKITKEQREWSTVNEWKSKRYLSNLSMENEGPLNWIEG